jgi:hypothetical protein
MKRHHKACCLTAAALLCLVTACGSSGSNTPVFNKPGDPEAIRKLLTPDTVAARQEGIAAAILLDTTGSMKEMIQGRDGQQKSKMQVAQAALLNLLQKFSDFAGNHPDTKIRVGIYEFSTRPDQPSCRPIIPLSPPDLSAARSAIHSVTPEGTTPIGDAMITAKRALDTTGFTHRHILVITDGENNRGYLPGDVAAVIAGEPREERAAIYFIAFDVEAEAFDPVKEAGGLVLAAGNEQQLGETLDFILTGKILVEQPPGIGK